MAVASQIRPPGELRRSVTTRRVPRASRNCGRHKRPAKKSFCKDRIAILDVPSCGAPQTRLSSPPAMDMILVKIFATALALSEVTTQPQAVKTHFDPVQDRAEVVQLLRDGCAHDLLERRPDALSGGEKQRVAIGRALLTSPHLLLMDEPLASLDESLKEEILQFIERLRDEAQVPIVYVSH